jgi:hypothetical protein
MIVVLVGTTGVSADAIAGRATAIDGDTIEIHAPRRSHL